MKIVNKLAYSQPRKNEVQIKIGLHLKKEKAESVFIPIGERPWLYDKNGNVRYIISYPTTSEGKSIKEKQKTNCGGLETISTKGGRRLL